MTTIQLVMEQAGSYDSWYEIPLKAFFNDRDANSFIVEKQQLEQEQNDISVKITQFYNQWVADNHDTDDDFEVYDAKQELAICEFCKQQWPHLDLHVDLNWGSYVHRDSITYRTVEIEVS